ALTRMAIGNDATATPVADCSVMITGTVSWPGVAVNVGGWNDAVIPGGRPSIDSVVGPETFAARCSIVWTAIRPQAERSIGVVSGALGHGPPTLICSAGSTSICAVTV